eukprot:620417-Lingulodinium_polyedra.AAC.1
MRATRVGQCVVRARRAWRVRAICVRLAMRAQDVREACARGAGGLPESCVRLCRICAIDA